MITDRQIADWEGKFAKTFGDGTLLTADLVAPYEVISTGSLTLDYALGVGGYVEGRLVEVWGADALGKTTLSLCGMAEAQKKHSDKLTGFIDMEQTFDLGLARGMGVDTAKLKIVRPSSAEDVADALKEMLRSGFFSYIVLDSIGAMIPEAEKEKDADEAVVASQAKIVTRMVKIAAVEARKSGTVVILINQVRSNIGGYGADTMTGGGFALKHVTTHKLKLKRTGTSPYFVKVDGEDRMVGHEIAIDVERNKVAPPRKIATINLFNQASEKYGPRGVDKADEASLLGLKPMVGAIQQNGGWYTILSTGEKVQGREAVVSALRADPELVADIRSRALAAISGEVVVGQEAEVEIEGEEDAV